jgi:Tfp pilus assembly protein PilF
MNACPNFYRVTSLALLLSLCACSSIPPYSPAPIVTPPAHSTAVVEPAAPVTETHPVEPVVTVEPSVPLPTTTPSTRNYTLSTATRTLVNQATAQRKGRNFVQAAATLERALRIEPKNPLLWLEYGELRMDENNFAQAESMARKALASASGDARTQASAWRLIADSYKARNQNSEAQQAYGRANSLTDR